MGNPDILVIVNNPKDHPVPVAFPEKGILTVPSQMEWEYKVIPVTLATDAKEVQQACEKMGNERFEFVQCVTGTGSSGILIFKRTR